MLELNVPNVIKLSFWNPKNVMVEKMQGRKKCFYPGMNSRMAQFTTLHVKVKVCDGIGGTWTFFLGAECTVFKAGLVLPSPESTAHIPSAELGMALQGLGGVGGSEPGLHLPHWVGLAGRAAPAS